MSALQLSPEKLREIEERAHQRGYDTPEAYVLAALELFELDSQTEPEPLAARLRRSLQDALEGKTFPVSTLWNGIDDE